VGVTAIVHNRKFRTMYPAGLPGSSEVFCGSADSPLLSVQNQHYPGEYATAKVNVVIVEDHYDVLETINLSSP